LLIDRSVKVGKFTPKSAIRQLINLSLGLSLVGLFSACSQVRNATAPEILNSRYTDEQPALSGNGRYVAFVSNRDGRRKLLMYDLQQRQFVDLPGLNKTSAIAETPSLSRNGRYLVYISSEQGRPELELYDRTTRSAQVISSGYRGWVRNPSISPDGRYISFESSSRGQWDIEVLDRGTNIELDISDGSRR
jgi:Tol biopolymer transport system component